MADSLYERSVSVVKIREGFVCIEWKLKALHIHAVRCFPGKSFLFRLIRVTPFSAPPSLLPPPSRPSISCFSPLAFSRCLSESGRFLIEGRRKSFERRLRSFETFPCLSICRFKSIQLNRFVLDLVVGISPRVFRFIIPCLLSVFQSFTIVRRRKKLLFSRGDTRKKV